MAADTNDIAEQHSDSDAAEAEPVIESAAPATGQPLPDEQIAQIIEAALLAAEGPLTVDNLFRLFAVGELNEEEGRKQIRQALQSLEDACENRGVALQKVASGYRYQTRQDLSPWVSRLWEEKPPRYTRALLETLALVAYKQPVTRGDIEQIRGVSVSQNIMRTLLERDWIRVVGQREAPGRPSMYGTTKAFLDYFSLDKLEDLPPMQEIKAMIEPTLVAEDGETVTPDGEAQTPTTDGVTEGVAEEEAGAAEAEESTQSDSAADNDGAAASDESAETDPTMAEATDTDSTDSDATETDSTETASDTETTQALADRADAEDKVDNS
jgi:segregation and condensation protein B